jgi:acyl-CoA thioesterase FadM
MTAAAMQSSITSAFTAQMEITYRAPVFLGVAVTVQGQVLKMEGRKIWTKGEVVLADGRTATEATALFIVKREES